MPLFAKKNHYLFSFVSVNRVIGFHLAENFNYPQSIFVKSLGDAEVKHRIRPMRHKDNPALASELRSDSGKTSSQEKVVSVSARWIHSHIGADRRAGETLLRHLQRRGRKLFPFLIEPSAAN